MGRRIAPDYTLPAPSVFCVIEMQYRRGTTPQVEAVVSIPGREGTFLRSWPAVQGQINEAQVKDCLAWVELTVANSFMSFLGVQVVLPLD